MVREVEIGNSTEILEAGLNVGGLNPSDNIVTGVMSDLGKTLTFTISRYLKSGSCRKVSLLYLVPNFEHDYVTEYEILSMAPITDALPTTEYVFDISKVVDVFTSLMPEQLPDDEIMVRLFTYEANIVTDYGIKTLHVPYTVSYPGKINTPVSTDGWYVLRVLDSTIWSNTSAYYVGDIVYYAVDGTYYKCIADTSAGIVPINMPTYWSALSDEETRHLYEFGYRSENITGVSTIQTVLNSNVLVTRYVKQKYIYDLFSKTGYKKADDVKIISQLEKIMSMREAAVVYLKSNNAIMAKYMLNLIDIEVASQSKNNGDRQVVELITNFTV